MPLCYYKSLGGFLWPHRYTVELGGVNKGGIALYDLEWLLRLIVEYDTDYPKRYKFITEAMHLALLRGFKAGYRIDPNNLEWPVAFIELPTGQASWHMPQHVIEWDGHTTEEKHKRIQQFIDSAE